MAKISTYPIISVPTLNDLLIGTDVENLNETKNFSLGDISGLIGQGFVPYVGATGNVNLGTFTITAGSFIIPGGLPTQFVKADGSLDSTVYVPQTRTLTINGVTYNLSANRIWDLNTIDTLTTTGTSGAATYIGKTLNIPQYQAQGAYITQLSGEATGVGPGNAAVTLSNLAVISKVLTGLNVTGGTVVSTDTILQAFGKVQNQINGLAGGVEYQGVWNATTNTPFLQSSVGVQGHYYVVNVAGTTNLNGITDWQIGDWAIFNGSTWDKVDNTDAVVSVNGYVGAVVLTAGDVGAVPTTRTLTINGVGYNLSSDRSWTVGDVRTDQSYINPSWIASLAWTKITGTPTTLAGYGITDGALNTTTLTINGTTYDLTANRTWNVGTVTSVGTSGPLTGGTITGSGTIGITQSGALTDGYLSSTDWNTFNSKQAAISVNAPLTFVAGVVGITQSGALTDGYLSSVDWNTFNSKVSGSGTPNTLPMWGSSSSLVNSPLSYAADTFNFQYNSATGGTVNFTNIGLSTYTYSIQMNNFGSPRSTIHGYTDGLVIQSIGGTQVSRMFANGNLILGTGTVETGHKLTISGDLFVNTIINAITDTDRFIVSDGGIIKYRTGAEVLSDIGAQGSLTLTTTGTSGASTLIGNVLNIPQYTDQFVGTVTSVGLSMPSAFSVSNSPITSSGTIAVTGAGTASQYVRGDGTLADFPSGGGGGGSSVSYYLNGSVNQGTFGGNTYYEMSKTPILGAGTDFSIGTNGYIAQFITDVGDPNSLLIPAGNWNFETYFNASSSGGTPSFYVELYKYDGTTFTLIASNSGTPEFIAFGTIVSPYFSALAVPETILTVGDRLAIRIYVITSGKTITLSTENSHLCQIITTFTRGLTTLNGLTEQIQYFQVGTGGTDFNIASSVATHTFNLPTASAVNRGALSSADWAIFNGKQNAITLTTTGTNGPATFIGDVLNVPNYSTDLSGYVTLATDQTITGLKTILRGGDVLNFKIGTDTIYGLKVAYNQNELVPSGEATWSFVNTFNRNGTGFSVTPLSFFRGVLVTGERLLSASVNTNLLDYYANNPSGRYPVYAYNTGVQQFASSIIVGETTGIVDAITGAIADLPAGVVANFKGRVIGSNAVNSNDFVTLSQLTSGYVTAVTASAPLASSGGTTPNLTIQQATATQNGFLSSTDWSTFNSKQNALTNPVTGTGTTNVVPKFTGSSTIGDSSISDNTNEVSITKRLFLNTGGQSILLTPNLGSVSNRIESSALPLEIITSGSAIRLAAGGVTPQFTLASTGVATFTSSVTAAGNIFTTNDAVFSTAGSITRHSTVGLVLRGATAIVFDLALYSANGTALITNPTGTNNIVFNSGNVLVGTTTDNGARLQVSGAGGIRINATTGTAAPGAIALSIRDSGNTAFGFDFNLEGVATGDLYLMRTNSSVQSTVLQIARATGAATFSGTLNGTSANFIVNQNSTVTNSFQNTNTTDTNSRNILDVTAGNSTLRFLSINNDHVYISPTTSRNTYLGFNYPLTLSSTGAATFSSSVTAGGFIISSKSTGGLLMGATNGIDADIVLEVSASGAATKFGSIGGSGASNLVLAKNGGNVLIGTTTDNGGRLQINGIAAFTSTSVGTGSQRWIGSDGSSGLFLNTPAGSNFNIAVNNNPVLGIASSGAATFSSSVNLGTNANAADTASLNIKQAGTSYNQGIYIERGGERNGYHMYIGGALDSLTFRRNYFGTQSDVMSLTRDGKVGIGMTTSEYGIVSIKSNSTTPYAGFNVYATGNGNFTYINHDNSVGIIGTEFGAGGTGQTPLTFQVGGSERMRITSGGYLKSSNNGIYNNATGAFHEFNQNLITGQVSVFRNSATSVPQGIEIAFTGADPNDTGSYMLGSYATSGGFVWIYRIFSNGTVSARSDARWKKNIETTRNGYIDDLCKLRVVKYNWYNHEDDAPKELGLIAQEVEEVFPNLIQIDPVIAKREVEQEDGTIIEEEFEDGVSRSIKTSVLPFMLLKAMQEQQEQIKELQAQIDKLKNL